MTQASGANSARAIACLTGVSIALLVVHLYAATVVGFGDSEALYAAYALHPQPAYLDHPGLVGVFARAIGGGTAPDPIAAHGVTSLLAAAVPWTMALLCRAAGAPWPRALWTALVFALVPQIAIGLFAMTPDLLLALAWIGSLAAAAFALRDRPGSTRATLGFAAAGLLAGTAAASKVTGVLLIAALVAAYASRGARPHARTVAPWAGIAAGLVVPAPVLVFEARTGWPMVAHRLIDTQQGAGVSLRNVGALLGGQLVYLSPVVAVVVALAARTAWRGRKAPDGTPDAVGALLLAATVIPASVLVPLALWSRVAEPHWIAPALLSLAPVIARAPAGAPGTPSRRLVVAAATVAALCVAVVHAWVLVPGALRLAPASYDARVDIANELVGWREVLPVVRESVAAQASPGLEGVAVVGPHWVICAQLEADLRGEVPVGCDTPVRDDFDGWYPRARWRKADAIVWVTDERFGTPPPMPDYAVARFRRVHIRRGGREVRVFTVLVLLRRAEG
jgi:hypothetical protein